MKMKQFRQGDIFLLEVTSVPDGDAITSNHKDLVLAHGVSTGNDHVLQGKKIVQCLIGNSRYIQIKQSASLVHPEHVPPIKIPKGIYKVVQQKQVNQSKVQRVLD